MFEGPNGAVDTIKVDCKLKLFLALEPMNALHLDFENFKEVFETDVKSIAELMKIAEYSFAEKHYTMSTKELFDIVSELRYTTEQHYKAKYNKEDEDSQLGLTTFSSLIDRYDNKLLAQIKECVESAMEKKHEGK